MGGGQRVVGSPKSFYHRGVTGLYAGGQIRFVLSQQIHDVLVIVRTRAHMAKKSAILSDILNPLESCADHEGIQSHQQRLRNYQRWRRLCAGRQGQNVVQIEFLNEIGGVAEKILSADVVAPWMTQYGESRPKLVSGSL